MRAQAALDWQDASSVKIRKKALVGANISVAWSTVYTVPAGATLVLESISASISAGSPGTVLLQFGNTPHGPYFSPPLYISDFEQKDYSLVAVEPIDLVVPADHSVLVGFMRSESHGAAKCYLDFSLGGYLIGFAKWDGSVERTRTAWGAAA